MKIGVIAGTPVDTRMGMEYVERYGHCAIGRASSPSPEIQLQMQRLHPQELTEQMISLCNEMIAEGAEGIYVNCNSMTAAVDMRQVCAQVQTDKLVTPFDVYKECAGSYQRLGILAVSGQSLAAIEQVIAEENAACMTFGAGLPFLAIAIEQKISPVEIIKQQGLAELLTCFQLLRMDALILGCTHFPYIAEELAKILPLPIIDPNARMLSMLCEM